MSASMMLVCQRDNSRWEDEDGNHNLALFVDETSMGYPSTAMGEYIQAIFHSSMTIQEQLGGIIANDWTDFGYTLNQYDVMMIKALIDSGIPRHENFDAEAVLDYFKDRVGERINTQNW